MNQSFSVILEPQPSRGFTVLVPALPEVVTEGDTEEEALVNAEEAIRAVLENRRAHALTIPSDATPEIRRVTVAALHARRQASGAWRTGIRALERAGFVVDRVVGSHYVMALPGDTMRTVTVPVDSARDLKPGTLRSIIRRPG